MEVANLKFVGEVEKHPELYNYTLKEYSRKDCTERAWNEVAKEVNLSAAECKEKWRNLRSTFVKNLKPKPSGSGAARKKPYYLMDALQFAIPYIKVAGTPTGNVPEIHQQRSSSTPDVSEIDNDEEETLLSENIVPQSDVSATGQQSPLTFSTVTSRPPSTSTPMSSGARGPTGHVNRDKRKGAYTHQSDADKAISQYCAAKVAKMSNTPTTTDKREEGIRNFVISLIPDLMQMNDVQLRIYKRRALLLIDEVTGTSSDILCGPNRNVVPPVYHDIAGSFVNPNPLIHSSLIVQSPTGSNVSMLSEQSGSVPLHHPENYLSPEESHTIYHQI